MLKVPTSPYPLSLTLGPGGNCQGQWCVKSPLDKHPSSLFFLIEHGDLFENIILFFFKYSNRRGSSKSYGGRCLGESVGGEGGKTLWEAHQKGQATILCVIRTEGGYTTERLHFHFSLSCTGVGNGNPLHCSCLENPRDGGAWWAAVYGVAQSRTRLKWLSSSSSSSRDFPQGALVVKNPPAYGGDIRDLGWIPGLGRSPGGGNGNPLQCSCLENPMVRGTWRATVHKGAKSQTHSEATYQHAGTSPVVCLLIWRVWVQSLVRELRSHMLWNVAKNLKKKIESR